MDKNREFAELAGILWHDEEFDMPTWYYDNEKKEWVHGIIESHNPDYAADPRLVLREMMKRKDWKEFASDNRSIHVTLIHFYPDKPSKTDYTIDIELILDTTGLLRDTAIEWMKRNS